MKSTKQVCKVESGYSYSGTEMIRIITPETPIGKSNLFIRLTRKREIISIQHKYDGFVKSEINFNLSGLPVGELVNEVITEYNNYGCLWNLRNGVYLDYKNAIELQSYQITGWSNVYNHPLYRMVDDIKNAKDISILGLLDEIKFNKSKCKEIAEKEAALQKENQQLREIIKYGSLLKKLTIKDKIKEIEALKAKNKKIAEKESAKKEADYLKKFHKIFGKDKTPSTVTRNVWGKGSRGHYNHKGTETFRGCIIATTPHTTTLQTIEGEIITVKD